MSGIEQRLAAIAKMTADGLKAEWRRVYKDVPPAGYTSDLLRLGLAYKAQDGTHGSLPVHVARAIDRRLRTPSESRSSAPTLSPGTRLVRDWHGESYHVLVTDTGYIYRDRQFRSLTTIARQITGARWSGPKFFGLVDRKGRGGVPANG